MTRLGYRPRSKDWWAEHPEERAAESARQKAMWTPQRRAEWATAIRERWRMHNPEHAAIRDRILARVTPEPCDRCDSRASVLLVTDYETEAYVWRCQPCAIAARKEWRTTAVMATGQ